jgi:hypothetical protein
MHHLSTYQFCFKTRRYALFAKTLFLLLLIFSNAVSLKAHTVDYFSSCGYVCAGNTVTVNAHLSATATNTNYNWQFRDKSGAWKCFVNGSNTINGVTFTASNATAKGRLTAAPTLTITNATTALSDIDVRIVMADGTNVSPCAAKPTFPVYGTDKSLKLHVLTGIDCSNIATYCSGGTPPLKLGDLVWNDINANGTKEADEPGVSSATIKLYADDDNDNIADGSAVATTTTNSLGIYSFSKLKSGNYIVGVIIPVGYTRGPVSTIDPDNDVNNDNNGVTLIGTNQAGSEVRSKAITLSASGETATDGDDLNSNLTLDIALCGNSQMGDFVWNDKNANGIQDLNEVGIQGVTVKLTFPDGVTTRTTTTNASGKYLFSSLSTGNYKVSFSTPAGFTPSPINEGTSDAKDSDPANGSVTVLVSAASSNLTIDAGFYTRAVIISTLSLGNQVWNDFDGDGKRDVGEPGIPGAPISLYRDTDGDDMPDGAAIKTTLSDAKGLYKFTDLAEGRYIASMPVLPGYQQSPNTTTQATSPFPDNNEDDDNNLVRLKGNNKAGEGILYTNAITLDAGEEPTDAVDGDDTNGNNTFDLAQCGNAYIGDFVWNDLNGNGIQEANEPGIDNVMVTITFSDGRTAYAKTHEYKGDNNPNAPILSGYYNFPNLGPGTYKITFETPDGLHPSPSNKGNDDAKDSDPVNGAPVTVILAADKSDFTIDAGFTDFTPPPPPPSCPNLSVGNMVFIDLNGNGTKEIHEPGIGGLTVKLYADEDGNNVADGTAISTLATADDGTYYFGNLAAGKYLVGVTTGNTYAPVTIGSTNPDDDKNNDNNGIKTINGEVFCNTITLSAGDEPVNDGSDNNSNLTLDFGLKLKASPCTTHCDCKNDCTHTDCGHSNCGHNSCKNDCKHSDCGDKNCGHNSCKSDCKHADCKHKNCSRKNNESLRSSSVEGTTSIANTITRPELSITAVTVFPNPAKDYIIIKVMAVKEGKGSARITDLSGKLVATQNVTISHGMNLIKFDRLEGLRGGTYYAQLHFNYHIYNQQLIVVK